MVEGIPPQEAMERLNRFSNEFEVKNKYYEINKKGEDLFGLQNQKYPALEQTKAEIANLNKLYSLYDTVSKTITAFKERAWADVVRADLEEMEETATKYGDMCLRLPKDLKEWAAYKDLKNQIESLKEVLPIIIDLKKPSIQPRHWIKI